LIRYGRQVVNENRDKFNCGFWIAECEVRICPRRKKPDDTSKRYFLILTTRRVIFILAMKEKEVNSKE
jgi:hypothetical protein